MTYALTLHPTPTGPTAVYRMKKVETLCDAFEKRLSRFSAVRRIKITSDQPKNATGKTVAFSVTAHVIFENGDSYVGTADTFVAKSKHVGFETSMRAALKEVETQVRRTHDKHR